MKEVEPRKHAIFFSGWLSPVKAFAFGISVRCPTLCWPSKSFLHRLLDRVKPYCSTPFSHFQLLIYLSPILSLLFHHHFLDGFFKTAPRLELDPAFAGFLACCAGFLKSFAVFRPLPCAGSTRGGRSGCCSSGHGS